MLRIPLGSRLREALMAACTSRAAPLISRSRSNWMMIRVEPWLLRLLIWLTPAILPRDLSSGVATLEAMISGLAPGRLACTVITGKSILGSGETGNRPKLTPPSSRIARLISMVATGRAIKGADRFIAGASYACFLPDPVLAPKALTQTVEKQVDHRRGEQGQQLAEQQAANQYQAQRLAQLRAGTGGEHQRYRTEQRRQGGHQNRPETQQRGAVDRIRRAHALMTLGLQGEVDHHDGVLLDDADQQDDADDGDQAQVIAGQQQRQQRANRRRR